MFKKVWTHFALLVLLTRPLLQRFKVLRISTPTICTTQGTWVSTCSFCFWMFLSAILVVPHTYRVVYLIGSLHFQYWKGKRVEASHSYHSTKQGVICCFADCHFTCLVHSSWLVSTEISENSPFLPSGAFPPGQSRWDLHRIIWLGWEFKMTARCTNKWSSGCDRNFKMTARFTKHSFAQYRPLLPAQSQIIPYHFETRFHFKSLHLPFLGKGTFSQKRGYENHIPI